MKEPLITFIIRTHNRPKLLEKNRDSVLMQTDEDWDRLVLIDERGRGLHHANGMLARYKEEVRAKYIYILDDDNRLIVPDFVEGVRAIIEESAPDIIMVKARIDFLGILPDPWRGPFRLPGDVDGLNFIVERKLWQTHIHEYHRFALGDFYFIKKLFTLQGLEIFWWDRVVAEAMQIGRLRDRK